MNNEEMYIAKFYLINILIEEYEKHSLNHNGINVTCDNYRSTSFTMTDTLHGTDCGFIITDDLINHELIEAKIKQYVSDHHMRQLTS